MAANLRWNTGQNADVNRLGASSQHSPVRHVTPTAAPTPTPADHAGTPSALQRLQGRLLAFIVPNG